ncbi:2-octaprenyl-6-methoxyphenyl hydroxylase [Halomonas sp. GXIMD04776]|uniref:2-octaprenyl-6-methoxyphenyl hydroxylase n=1 Tax=Halomonas sp. GXIMD04776 TaxID=3415605 RepID=UPI003CA785D1
MTHRHQVDIAIVGGGLVGASLGCALAPLIQARGLRVAVIEAAALPRADLDGYQPSFDARASAIAQGSRWHFQTLGVWDEMARQARSISMIHVSEQSRLGATRLTAEELGVEALGYVVPNAWMGQVLHARLAELELDWHCPAKVEHITPQADGHRLVLSDDHEITAALTLLADGGRSGLKEQLGIASHEVPYEQSAVIANLEVSQPHHGVAFERFTRNGPLALLPLGRDRMELIWTHESGTEGATLALSDADFLTRLQHVFGERAGRFRRVGKRHAYPLSLITADEVMRPGLAVLGNAAHALHPVAGQGFNLALRGVMDLVAALEQGLAQGYRCGDMVIMNAFEARRVHDRRNVIRFSDGLVRLFGITHPLLSHARAAGLVGLNLAGPLRRTLARRAMGLER